MKVQIIVPDKLVIVDGYAVEMPSLDWSRFLGTDAEWDDIDAIHFNSESGQGHVEYRTIVTAQATRPNITPGNWQITQADFDANYAWVLPPYQARKIELEEIKRLEAERRAAEAQVEQPVPDLAASEDVDALRRQVADLTDTIERLKTSVAQSL